MRSLFGKLHSFRYLYTLSAGLPYANPLLSAIYPSADPSADNPSVEHFVWLSPLQSNPHDLTISLYFQHSSDKRNGTFYCTEDIHSSSDLIETFSKRSQKDFYQCTYVKGNPTKEEDKEKEDFHYVDLSFKTHLGFAKEIRDIFAACPPERAQNLHQIFGRTPFGPWPELTNTAHDPLLMYMFLQLEVDVLNADSEEIYFEVRGKHMRFGHLEFCLITGLLFGPTPSLPVILEGSFVRRLWPDNAPGNLKMKTVVHRMRGGLHELSDEDVVRVCFVVMVEVMFMGRELSQEVSDTVLRVVDDLVTFDSYPWGSHIWSHTYSSLHNAIARRHLQKNKNINKKYGSWRCFLSAVTISPGTRTWPLGEPVGTDMLY